MSYDALQRARKRLMFEHPERKLGPEWGDYEHVIRVPAGLTTLVRCGYCNAVISKQTLGRSEWYSDIYKRDEHTRTCAVEWLSRREAEDSFRGDTSWSVQPEYHVAVESMCLGLYEAFNNDPERNTTYAMRVASMMSYNPKMYNHPLLPPVEV